jgi:hypothetical protein
MPLAILTLRPQSHAISKYRLQLIEVASPDIQPFINYNSGQMLPHSLPHHSRLAKIDREPFLDQNSKRPTNRVGGSTIVFSHAY